MRAWMCLSIALTGAIVLTTAAQAACNATVNGRPMSIEECVAAQQIYGGVAPGHYRVDQAGNWINLSNPSLSGNFYLDAQRPRGASSGSSGLTRTPFGSVGGGYYFDNETGASVGP